MYSLTKKDENFHTYSFLDDITNVCVCVCVCVWCGVVWCGVVWCGVCVCV